jgi:uncharacterized protein
MWTILITGFTLGLAGSLHCVGMCGPLSLALPTWHLSKTARFFSLFLYQSGRVITYSILGLLFGLAGRSIYIAGLQQWFSIGLGILILLAAAVYFIQKHSVHFSFLKSFYVAVQKLIGRILRNKKGHSGFLLLGMANGLLPCGMVYIALATTLSLRKVYESIGFMAMFGAGTAPAMMLIAYGTQMMNPSIRLLFRKSIPFFIILAGLLLILRGMNLGIMFISPELTHASVQAVNCHP